MRGKRGIVCTDLSSTLAVSVCLLTNEAAPPFSPQPTIYVFKRSGLGCGTLTYIRTSDSLHKPLIGCLQLLVLPLECICHWGRGRSCQLHKYKEVNVNKPDFFPLQLGAVHWPAVSSVSRVLFRFRHSVDCSPSLLYFLLVLLASSTSSLLPLS